MVWFARSCPFMAIDRYTPHTLPDTFDKGIQGPLSLVKHWNMDCRHLFQCFDVSVSSRTAHILWSRAIRLLSTPSRWVFLLVQMVWTMFDHRTAVVWLKKLH